MFFLNLESAETSLPGVSAVTADLLESLRGADSQSAAPDSSGRLF